MLSKALKDISILLVEDNEMNTLLASAILQRTGAGITEAANGMEAIDLLKKRAFDVVLMDLHLPVMNGFDTTRYIRENLKLDVPVIAITANVINGEESKCLEAGMNGFVSKPYTEKDLLEKIQRIINMAESSSIVRVPASDAGNADLYSLSALENICRGNRGMIADMLKAFIKQVPVTVKDITAAYQSGDFQSIYAAAHNIKPNIETLGISSLKENIRQIESFAALGKNDNELLQLITVLDTTLFKVVEQLKTKELV
jgi:CheY-like chemotaxis protein/HPt (histidine-containing phosphotransfer) domain-containing protein